MKKNLILIAASSLLILGASGCSKKISSLSSDYFTTVPTPLETSGSRINADINGRIPAKVMVKNALVRTTPVLVWDGGEAAAGEYLMQGENVRDNGQIISWADGGNVRIPFSLEYKPEMQKSDLYLDFQVQQGGKTYTIPRVKVGYGVLSTSTLASAETVEPAKAADGFNKVITEKYSADIRFLVNQANIRASETASQGYIDLNKQLQEANADPKREIAGITVSSFASPEGTLAFNTALAEKREKNTTDLVESQLKKDKITEFGELTSSFTPEDWEGFRELVEKSNIQDKDLIISVLKMYPDPEQREKEIRNLSSVFNELADIILPQLRYSRVQAQINVIGKTDAELIDIYNSNPSQLSVDEILYIATLTDDNTRKMDIYNKAVEIYPQDYRTYNNLGATQYAAGDYAAAKSSFNKAASINRSAKEPDLNIGLIDMIEGNYADANSRIGAAAGLPEAADALGVYYLSQGQTANALTAFGDSKTNNAALAQILAKDYNTAKSTLASIAEPDAITYYLTAILGARTNNESMVMSNLRQAVRLDSSLLKRAKSDLEFVNYNLSTI